MVQGFPTNLLLFLALGGKEQHGQHEGGHHCHEHGGVDLHGFVGGLYRGTRKRVRSLPNAHPHARMITEGTWHVVGDTEREVTRHDLLVAVRWSCTTPDFDNFDGARRGAKTCNFDSMRPVSILILAFVDRAAANLVNYGVITLERPWHLFFFICSILLVKPQSPGNACRLWPTLPAAFRRGGAAAGPRAVGSSNGATRSRRTAARGRHRRGYGRANRTARKGGRRHGDRG